MNRIARAWAWARTNKSLIAACALTGGEGAVTMGVPLPGAELIPQSLRGLAIVALGAAALYFRMRAQKEAGRG